MTDETASLHKRGYSCKEVAELVSSEGCRVTVGSLNRLLEPPGDIATKGAGVNAPPRPSHRRINESAGPRRPGSR